MFRVVSASMRGVPYFMIGVPSWEFYHRDMGCLLGKELFITGEFKIGFKKVNNISH